MKLILFIILAVGVISGFLLFSGNLVGPTPPSVRTKSIMLELKSEITEYSLITGKHIGSLDELKSYFEGKNISPVRIIDAWDNPLMLEISNGIPNKIISYGQDGKPDGIEENEDIVLEIKYSSL